MKKLMILPALFLASPAVAHPGLHIAPHGAEWMPVFMGLAVIGTAAALALRARVKAAAKARK
jgi:CHASE1-domain containing sensor protein